MTSSLSPSSFSCLVVTTFLTFNWRRGREGGKEVKGRTEMGRGRKGRKE
jgi:hypothetical protein